MKITVVQIQVDSYNLLAIFYESRVSRALWILWASKTAGNNSVVLLSGRRLHTCTGSAGI